jgi:hypothetical protein
MAKKKIRVEGTEIDSVSLGNLKMKLGGNPGEVIEISPIPPYAVTSHARSAARRIEEDARTLAREMSKHNRLTEMCCVLQALRDAVAELTVLADNCANRRNV